MTVKNTNETLNEELQDTLDVPKEIPQEDTTKQDDLDTKDSAYWWQRW